MPFTKNGCQDGDGTQGLEFTTEVELAITGENPPPPVDKLTIHNSIPAPFGSCTLPVPAISGTDRASVRVGEVFTIEGSALLSSAITDVFIGGNALDVADYFPVPDGSNSKIKVIAPVGAVGENQVIDVRTAGGTGSGGSITITGSTR